jgi:hypothetical protein
MNALAWLARSFGMTDEAWRRHANPWSVWTRFAAIPAMILAVWSRAWIGWWALVPVAAVAVWLWVNPHVFPAVTEPRSWAAKGIYGERLWLNEPASVAPADRVAFRWLFLPGLGGIALLAWGLVALLIWPTVFGAAVITLAQLWRLDRLGRLYERHIKAFTPVSRRAMAANARRPDG